MIDKGLGFRGVWVSGLGFGVWSLWKLFRVRGVGPGPRVQGPVPTEIVECSGCGDPQSCGRPTVPSTCRLAAVSETGANGGQGAEQGAAQGRQEGGAGASKAG